VNPIDLKSIAAGRFRIALDEAALAEPGGKKDPWYQVIPCRNGQIYPYSDKLLAVHVNGYAARRRLADIAGLSQHNWSDDGEAIFIFPLDLFEKVAEIVKPRRKRKLSESHRKALLESSRDNRFKHKSAVLNTRNKAKSRPIPIRL